LVVGVSKKQGGRSRPVRTCAEEDRNQGGRREIGGGRTEKGSKNVAPPDSLMGKKNLGSGSVGNLWDTGLRPEPFPGADTRKRGGARVTDGGERIEEKRLAVLVDREFPMKGENSLDLARRLTEVNDVTVSPDTSAEKDRPSAKARFTEKKKKNGAMPTAGRSRKKGGS